MKILIADDEQDILDFLEFTFKKEGYEVITAADGIQALKKARLFNPDIFLLDIMMPNLEGTSVCEQLRMTDEFKNTPIVFLTAQGNEETEVKAFQIGADDFIAKPIKPKSLILRINLLLKKKINNNLSGGLTLSISPKETVINDIVINHEHYSLIYKGKNIELARKEFKLVELLASNPGKVFTRKEIFNSIWGSSLVIGDRTIDVHIRKIRTKTNDDFIKTVKGVGFKIDK
jgi:two-component system alkaline phosphatase synthesis response regulator PhoP